MADIATAPTVTTISGEIVEYEGSYKTRICLLSALGDASGVTGTLATNWWTSCGIQTLKHVQIMEPLTAATPDEDEFHLFKFLSSNWNVVYFGDAHGGGPMSATTFTAKIKIIGTG